jgi:AcrR family transcriptional regulator
MTSSSLRTARHDVVRERVLDGVAALLRDGEDVTFAAVARAAGVPERTVYRHFPNRQALMAAVYAWANRQAGFSGSLPTTAEEMTAMVRQVFPGFDTVSPVVDELLASEDGRRARLAAADERRAAARAVVVDARPDLDPKRRDQVAAVVQILGTAPVWQALRDFWEWDGATAADAVATAIGQLLSPSESAEPRPSRGARR